MIMDSKDALVVFEGSRIRRIWHEDQWYFSVVDVVQTLTDSPTPRQYWGKIKVREFQQLELSPIWVQLKLPSADGKSYKTDCANTESMFRIIHAIPSPKAEPFKRWLAKVGYERVQEIEVPELMREFLEWVNSGEAKKLDPVMVAGISHYEFVRIHTFVDGNGRNSYYKALDSFFMRQGLMK
jgi:hypothetical protein